MLVGRAAERQRIDRLLAGARLGEGGVLVVAGEPGVGKSALLDYARAGLDGFAVLETTGSESESDIPFAALHALLHPVFEYVDRLPGPQADALAAALALGAAGTADRFAVGVGTFALLCQVAEEQPLAVVVDDLHLLDRPSADALRFAARRIDGDRVAVLMATRVGEGEELAEGLPRLVLSGLGREDSARLVRATYGSTSDEQAARLHDLTGGNPLGLLELAGDAELLLRTGPVIVPLVGDAVVSAYGRRLAALSPEARGALLVAAVAGGDLGLVAAVSGRLGVDPATLAQAESLGMVVLAEGRLRFRHPLVRTAVYGDAPADRRRAVHLACAAELDGLDPDRCAWHLSEGTVLPDADVARSLEAAGVRATARAAHSTASTAFERAARLTAEPRQRLARLVEAARSALSAGLIARAAGLLAELPREQDPAVVTELRAAVAAGTGALAEARELLEAAARSESDPSRAVLLLADAVAATYQLADGSASRRLAEALEARLPDVRDRQSRAVGLVAIGMAKVMTGQGGAAEIGEALPVLTADSGAEVDPRRLRWLMLAPLFLRDAESARAGARSLVDSVRDRAGVGLLPGLLFLVARDQATSDSWARAEANYSEAIRLARDTGQASDLAVSLAGLAWLEARQGKVEECREHAREAQPLCADHQLRFAEAWIRFALGDLELSVGDPALAIEHFDGLERTLRAWGVADPDLAPGPELTDALVRSGRREDAARVAEAYAAAAEAKGRPWARARAWRALGLVAPAEEVDEHFGSALALHAETVDDFETARTRYAYGGRLRRAGRRVDAREQLRPALATFVALGAEAWAGLAAAELDATGELVGRREERWAAALTPQELQVSLLLAEGRTTREAAAALFLSPKTVEYHLRKVYVKLGIHTRAELADRLPR